MKNGLVTADGTKVLTVEEYDRFINAIPESMKAIFEINTITGLRYIELQRLYENPQWYYKERNQVTVQGMVSGVPWSAARTPSKTGKLFFLIVEM